MKKYRDHVDSKQKAHPDTLAKEALVNGEFASREREHFFNKAFADIMMDYTEQFWSTDPYEKEKREFIHKCVLALGDVKRRLIQYETYGKNIPHIEEGQDA